MSRRGDTRKAVRGVRRLVRAAAGLAGSAAALAGAAVVASVRWRIRGARPAVAAAAALALAGLGAASVAEVEGALEALGPAGSLAVGSPVPPWVPAGWDFEARRAASGPLYGPGRVAAVGAALSASPWVDRVLSVARDPRDGLVARVEFRVPALFVAGSAGEAVLDDDGWVLPAPGPGGPRPIRLEGARGSPPPPGRRWAAPEIAAGARLARVLLGSRPPVVPRLETIRLRRVAGGFSATLHASEGGAAIEWGRLEPAPLEVSEPAKLLHLAELLERESDLRQIEGAKVWTSEPVLRRRGR